MLPLLELASDDKEHSMKEVRNWLAQKFSLTEQEQEALLPSGQAAFANRVGWAKTYLTRAGALEAPRRGQFRISDRGKDILREKPRDITTKFLKKFPEFVAFMRPQLKHEEVAVADSIAEDKQTPEECSISPIRGCATTSLQNSCCASRNRPQDSSSI
jgi:restriction system protein